MKYAGTIDELVAIVASIVPVQKVDTPGPLHARIRAKGGIVVNWYEKKHRIVVQGKPDKVSQISEQLAALFEKGDSNSSVKATSPRLPPDPNEPKLQAGKKYSYRPAKAAQELSAPYVTDKDSELVIALVAAVGTDLGAITSVLTERLKTFKYTASEIKISNDIIAELRAIPTEPHFERVSALMSEGNSEKVLATILYLRNWLQPRSTN